MLAKLIKGVWQQLFLALLSMIQSSFSEFLKVTPLMFFLHFMSIRSQNRSIRALNVVSVVDVFLKMSPLSNTRWTISTFETLSSVICEIILLFCWMLYIARFKCCSETPFHFYAQYSPMASSHFAVPRRNHCIVILELALVFHQVAKHMLEQLTLALLSI